MSGSNDAQVEYWNGRAGHKWAALHVSLDLMLSNATAELKQRAGSVSGKRVLDIGCGAGETCAIWLDGGAQVTGVDVSAPMLAVAAKRLDGKVTLVEADAAAWRGDAPFDLAVSRFGVMFFDEPEKAFANIAANLRPGGRLLFECWRAPTDNAWATVPIGAIRDLLPEAPPPVPHAPGPFALADKDRLHGILERAGFADIAIQPFDFPACMASEGGAEAASQLAMQLGPSGAALAGTSEEVRALAAQRLRAALAPHEHDGRVSLGGGIWIVEAVRRP